MAKFEPDPGNPVVVGGSLWARICGSGKSCPTGTVDEGTPEILKKQDGYFYVTFHGAHVDQRSIRIGGAARPVVTGYRGVAKTRDWRHWITSADLPADALWSPRDCQGWNVAWNTETGCIGGGGATTLVTRSHVYMLIESADDSLGCTDGQHWEIGLVRGRGLEPSGGWRQWPKNPLIRGENGSACAVQYPRLFVDGGRVYLTYWTLGPKGVQDSETMFHLARLTAKR
jgi:hypothetical protein